MRRDDEDWGTRRPATRRSGSERRSVRKPYNDDYKEDSYRKSSRYREDEDYDYVPDEDYEDYDSGYEEVSSRRGSRSGERSRSEGYEGDGRSSRSRSSEGSSRSGRSSSGNSRSRSREDSRGRSREDSRGSRDRYYEEDSRNRRNRSYEEDARSRRNRSYEEDSRSGRGRSYEESRGRRYEDYDEPGRGGRKKKSRRRGLGCLIPLVLLLVVVLGAVFLVFYAGSLWSKVDSADFRSADIKVNEDLPDSVVESTKDYRTIMVFGVDSRDNSTLQAGTLADSNIIVSINKKTGEVKLLSIYRDTYVETTEGEHMKLTEVYNKYGAKEQLQTINKNFDMNVTEYVTVNWKAVAQTIDELGGLDIELSEGEAEGINKYMDEVSESTGIDSEHIEVKEGTQHLDGVQAVTYCRLRKGLGDDYKRTERQRTVVSLTLAKAKKAGIPKVIKVCNAVFPGISSSLSLTEIMTLALGMGKFDIAESSGFPFDNASQDGGRYYLFPVTLASNVKELHEYLYNNTEYEPSGTVQGLSSEVSDFSGYYGK